MAAGTPTEVALLSDQVVLGDGLTDPLRVVAARVTVRGDRIVSVAELEAEQIAELRAAPGDIGVDLGDRLLSPAFVNGHTHLSMVAYRGIGGMAAMRGHVIEDLYFRLERELTADDIRAFVRLGAYESLLHGVGFVWDHYYAGGAVAEGLAEVGLAGVVAPTLQDLEGPGVAQLDGQLDATLNLAADQRMRERGVLAALGPHATDTVSDALWRRLTRVAAEHQLPIHAHAAQTFDELRRSHERHGCSPVSRLERLGVLDDAPQLLLVHAIYVSDDDLALLPPARTVLGFCPYSQLQFCFAADVESWTDAGLRWLVATDCACSNDSMNLQKELRLVAGLRLLPVTSSPEHVRFRQRARLDDAEAVHRLRQQRFSARSDFGDSQFLLPRVWAIPGAMHPAVRCGVIAPDALANLIVWDRRHPSLWPAADPLRALALDDATPAIDGLMIGGRWIGERGRFAQSLRESANYRAAFEEAERRLQLHARRAGIHSS